MRSTALGRLVRVLAYGQPATRHTAAARLLREGEPADWARLASTIHSDASWQVRARCLEALGLVAGEADQATAEAILDLVCGTVGDDHRSSGAATDGQR